MAVLSWGKPTVEIVLSNAGAIPATPVWVALPDIKDGSSKLTPTKGTKLTATAEGGDLVDVRYPKNSFAFECEVFVKKGDTRPIADADGLIIPSYCIRLTPEDNTQEGWIMENTSVSCDESWSSAEGKMLKYTFEGLKPATGNMLKPYTKV